MTPRLSNIDIATFESFLRSMGCEKVKSGNPGHFKWKKPGCTRPVIFQTHIEPIPEFIIRNNLRNIGLTADDFRNWLKKRK